MLRVLIIILTLLITVTAAGFSPRMLPRQTELLPHPIALECGVTIREWRDGSHITEDNIKRLNAICTRAVNSFKPFLETKGVKTFWFENFHWNISMIPDCKGPRCLNDITERFRYRQAPPDVWGYTGEDERYSFIISDISHGLFATIFSHELFHAMNYYTGLYSPRTDEQYAVDFTKYLGLPQP